MTTPAQQLRAARVAHAAGDHGERDRLVLETVAALQAAATDAERASCAHSLASFYRDIERLAESEKYARLAVDYVRRSGSVTLLGNHLMFLALLLRDTQRLREAVEYAEQALPCYVETHGPDHGEVRYIASFLVSLRRLRDHTG